MVCRGVRFGRWNWMLAGGVVVLLSCGLRTASAGHTGGSCSSCIPTSEASIIGTTSDQPAEDDVSSCAFNDFIVEWYCYTPSCSGVATAATCSDVTEYDTTLAVYSNCALDELVCNDDFCGQTGGGKGEAGLQAQVSWPVSAGTTYFIRLSGFNGESGVFQLDLACGSGDADFFLDESVFLSTLASGGAAQVVGVGFEEAMLPPPPNNAAVIPDPLNSSTNNDVYQSGDIPVGLVFQSNLDAPGLGGPNPRGNNGLGVAGGGFMGAVDVAVIANFPQDSYDILAFPLPFPKTNAVGLNLVSFENGNSADVHVFDTDEKLVARLTMPVGVPGNFLGILLPSEAGIGGTSIGRINVHSLTSLRGDLGGGREGLYSATSFSFGACPADLSGDNEVGPADLAALLGAWGPNPGHPADFNASGTVNGVDLAFLLGSWGPCPPLLTSCGQNISGDCCDIFGNGTPGCDDLECCQLICELDPFCCDVSWDSLCAEQAIELCDVCGFE